MCYFGTLFTLIYWVITTTLLMYWWYCDNQNELQMRFVNTTIVQNSDDIHKKDLGLSPNNWMKCEHYAKDQY